MYKGKQYGDDLTVFFSSRRRHTSPTRDWSSDVCSSDLPQPPDGSLAPKVDPAEAKLDFKAPAEQVLRAVRAFTPSPGAWTTLRGRRLKVSRAERATESARLAPGRLAIGPGGK